MSQPAEIPVPTTLRSWEVNLRPSRVVFGPGRLEEVGELVRELGGRRVLVVTDAGIRSAGHVDTAVESLLRAQLSPRVFDEVAENPTTRHVGLGVESARSSEVDFIVGLGGGSAMDCAKGINFLVSNGGRMEDYWGFNKATKPMLPSIGIPCTAGTGSEAQSFALIAQEESHLKMACGDEKVRFLATILDPLLVVTAPQEVTALAGFDAISHAVESHVTKARNPLSKLFAMQAWSSLSTCYPALLTDDPDLDAWGGMLLGAHLAGAAIETSMLGAAHALANPLTARFGTTHGAAVALVLPGVVRANAEVVESLYAELSLPEGDGGTATGAGDSLASHLETLRDAAGMPSSLADVDVVAAELPRLAREATEQWTLQHNPRPLSEGELLAIYEGVLT